MLSLLYTFQKNKSIMQKHLSIFFVALCAISITTAQQITSPSEFLGYEIGTKFSRHHQVVDYFKEVASQVPNQVKLEKYGETYERRPLYVTYISSEENMRNLETIRQDNLKNAGIMSGSSNPNVAIVWLSYNVHGNEASSSEASMLTLYKLLTEKQNWLKNTVVIIDPCINPDGRDRYANWFNETASMPYDISQEASDKALMNPIILHQLQNLTMKLLAIGNVIFRFKLEKIMLSISMPKDGYILLASVLICFTQVMAIPILPIWELLE